MHLDLGTNIDAGWTDQIVLGADGVNWSESIRITDIIRVGSAYIAVANDPRYEYRATIALFMSDGTKTKFDVQDVANQPTWQKLDGTRTAKEGLQNAVNDINSWL
jgi:hypothetical protein